MKVSSIGAERLCNQKLSGSKPASIKELVSYMGAMQAQDYNMAKLAIGLRVSGATHDKVEKAISRGEVIRTHVLRATWHFVAPEDLHWMLDLSADNIKRVMSFRDRELELNESVFKKSARVFEKALQKEKNLTREELIDLLKQNKINTTENRASHLLVHSEVTGLICSGELKNGRQTYALLDERIKKRKKLNKDEALAKLAVKYFTSHGPATLADFTWWSGLSNADSKEALELAKSKLTSEKIGERVYWRGKKSTRGRKSKKVFLLPGYDEFLISYKDRSAVMSRVHHPKILSVNGIFKPVVIVNNQVTGLWKRSIEKDQLVIEPEMFDKPNKNLEKQLEKAASTLGRFYGEKVLFRPGS